MQLTKKEERELQVKKSRNGRGIFAKKDFQPEDSIFQVRGRFVTCNEDDDMDEEERANTFRFDRTYYISPKGRLGDMLNHSCEPNAKVVKKDGKLFIVALETITKGKEVTIDYATILGSDDSWDMQCNCGTAGCRRLIRGFATLPKKVQSAYKKRGMVPRYIA